jgi:hypothetical protein
MTATDTRVLGVCEIGQHIKKTGYVLLRYAYERTRGWHVQIEPLFTSISNEEMAQHGLSAVLDLLRNTPDSDSCKAVSYFDETTKKQISRLKRNHVFVNLELLRSDREEMKMIPLHGGRSERRAEEVRVFPLPTTNEEFMKPLAEALEVAS